MQEKGKVLMAGLAILLYGLIQVTTAGLVRADIYCYVDGQGRRHFSNVPTSPEYELYVMEGPGMPGQPAFGRYDAYILESAHKHDVPFSLIKAIIKAESAFDPYAVSKAGARGLMQIMPRTARDLGVTDLFDPRANILGGVRYFKELLRRFDGSLPLALAAYNAGPGHVSSLGRVPRIKETQHFVRKVMEYYEGY